MRSELYYLRCFHGLTNVCLHRAHGWTSISGAGIVARDDWPAALDLAPWYHHGVVSRPTRASVRPHGPQHTGPARKKSQSGRDISEQIGTLSAPNPWYNGRHKYKIWYQTHTLKEAGAVEKRFSNIDRDGAAHGRVANMPRKGGKATVRQAKKRESDHKTQVLPRLNMCIAMPGARRGVSPMRTPRFRDVSFTCLALQHVSSLRLEFPHGPLRHAHWQVLLDRYGGYDGKVCMYNASARIRGAGCSWSARMCMLHATVAWLW